MHTGKFGDLNARSSLEGAETVPAHRALRAKASEGACGASCASGGGGVRGEGEGGRGTETLDARQRRNGRTQASLECAEGTSSNTAFVTETSGREGGSKGTRRRERSRVRDGSQAAFGAGGDRQLDALSLQGRTNIITPLRALPSAASKYRGRTLSTPAMEGGRGGPR